MLWPLWIMGILSDFKALRVPAESEVPVAEFTAADNRGTKMAEVSDTVLQQILTRLTAIESKQAATYQLLISVFNATGAELMSLQDVLAKVEAQNTVIGSVETLLTDLNQRLKDAIAANDPAMVQQISDELDANTTRIATAVVTGTPHAPTP